MRNKAHPVNPLPEPPPRVDLLPCPFCGDAVELEYEPIVSYSINCCVSMCLQICDALEDRGVRFDAGYEYIPDDKHENGRGDYTDAARLVCREELTKEWNTRPDPA